MTTPRWRSVSLVPALLAAWALASACNGAPADEATEASARRQMAAASRKPAAVDTIRNRMAAAARGELQPRAGAVGYMVVLFIRERDVFTCEDLGRQSRELRSWAEDLGLPFVVWAQADADTRIPVFLRREHIPQHAVFLARSPPPVENGDVIRSPAAMLVRLSDGEIRGFAHPERVPNVRQRSFAQELRDIYRS